MFSVVQLYSCLVISCYVVAVLLFYVVFCVYLLLVLFFLLWFVFLCSAFSLLFSLVILIHGCILLRVSEHNSVSRGRIWTKLGGNESQHLPGPV